MSGRMWCDMGFSLATYLHSMSTGLSVTCVCKFCVKRDKSCTTFVIVENKKATHLCTELHCNVGLPLCWKAFSENTTPHQQHWANSVRKGLPAQWQSNIAVKLSTEVSLLFIFNYMYHSR